MYTHLEKNDIILICDKTNIILHVYADPSDSSHVFEVSHNLSEYVAESSMEIYVHFIGNLNTQGYSNDYSISFSSGDVDINYTLSALARQNRIFILASSANVQETSLEDELMRINNEQTNHFRMTLKENMVKHQAFQTRENHQLDEISKLNNELINSRRELAKKNQQLKSLNEELERQATHDPLTGLLNRRQLEHIFSESKERAKRLNTNIIIASIDINHFKSVNDQLGHAEGDRLLIHFANLAKEMTRQGYDYVFRVGGDEFLFLLLDCSLENAQAVYDRIHKAFIQETSIASLAFGLVEVDPSGPCTLDECLRIADERMYIHKKKSR
jgi:diguanylate cyclase (GGDEF)-like protein